LPFQSSDVASCPSSADCGLGGDSVPVFETEFRDCDSDRPEVKRRRV
jgi:hypothetical protein